MLRETPPNSGEDQPDAQDAPVGVSMHGLWAAIRAEASLGRALLLSAVLHGAFFGVGALVGALIPSADIAFDESAGVAMMSRLGMAAIDMVEEMPTEGSAGWEGDDPSAQMPTELPPEEELPLEEELPDEAALPEEELPSEETPPEAEAAETVEEPTPEEAPEAAAPDESETPPDSIEDPNAPPAPTPEEVEAAAAAEAARVEAERAATAERRRLRAERQRQEAEAEAAELDRRRREEPMTLPPGVRYPVGTLNPVATDVGMWGPEGAAVTVVLRNDRIRRSPHRRAVETILSGLPDWQNLVGGAQIDVFEDVDAMLIASSDPRYINRTFLAVLHHVPPDEIVARLGAGYPGGINWEVRRGRVHGIQANPRLCPLRNPTRPCDPREFLLPTGNLFVLSRPEFLRPLLSDAPRATGLTEAVQAVEDPEILAALLAPNEGSDEASVAARAERDSRRRAMIRRNRADGELALREAGWINGLLQLTEYGGTGSTGPAATLTGRVARFRLEGQGSVRAPQEIHANIFAETDLRLTGRFVFEDQAQAEAWIAQWPAILQANRIPLALVGFYVPLRDATWEVDHNEAIVAVTIPADVVRTAATTVAAMRPAGGGEEEE